MARCLERLALGLLALIAGCTDADLEPHPRDRLFRDDRLAIEGDFCTASPETRLLPVRVLFVVDTSQSLNVTDPTDPVTMDTRRQRAMRDAVDRILNDDPEAARVGVLRFASVASSQTPEDANGDGIPERYFSSDPVIINDAIANVGNVMGRTNFINALSEAYFELRNEFDRADLESLPLSKYIVVFVSDGVPDSDSMGDRRSERAEIIANVEQMRELARLYRVGEFEFHTVYIEGPSAVPNRDAVDLLSTMAEAGGGLFRSFASGESVDFLFVDFSAIRRVFTLKTLSALNLTALVDTRQIPKRPEDAGVDGDAGDAEMEAAVDDAGVDADPDADTDADAGDAGDGSTRDAARPTFADLDGDGWPSCGERLVDSDGDNLWDELEVQLMTDPLVPDTDDDGLRDGLEWALRNSGLDPLDPADSRCYVPETCVDTNLDGFCDCVRDVNANGVCDCADNDEATCADDLRHDCVDIEPVDVMTGVSMPDGLCDCPDADDDGRCDYPDRDGDGLVDCEEIFFGTASRGPDTEADGLPDLLEIRMRTNAGEPDGFEDIDFDRVRNGVEALGSTDPWCDDSSIRSLTTVGYQLETLGLRGGSTCYTFDVGNITLVPSRVNPDAVYPGNGWNRVMLYAGEVPFDDPETFASYRVACVMAAYDPEGNYKAPASGRIRLRPDDFVNVGEFDADRDCIWP